MKSGSWGKSPASRALALHMVDLGLISSLPYSTTKRDSWEPGITPWDHKVCPQKKKKKTINDRFYSKLTPVKGIPHSSCLRWTHTASSELGGEAVGSVRGLAGFRFCLFAQHCAARIAETMLILPAQHVGLSTRSSTSLQKCLIIVCGPKCANSWHNVVSGDWDTLS